jgi:hypothetical protein
MVSVRAGADVHGLAGRLRPVLGDRLLLPADGAFEPARRVWNGAVARRPAAIARCLDADEVRACVLAARERGVRLCVRGGRAKRRYDPEHVFASAVPTLAPTG